MKKARESLAGRILALVFAGLLCWGFVPQQVVYADEATSIAGEADGGGQDGGEEQGGDAAAHVPSYADGMYQPSFEVAAEGVYIANEDSGVVMYTKNPDTQMSAASLVKLMTAIVVMDEIDDLDGTMITAETWVFDRIYGLGASNADIWPGETLSVRELLYATILPSGCEAALILAGYVGGTVDNFVYKMNLKAEQLGCTNTVFTEPTGLDEGNLSTPRDMAAIMRAFMSYPTLVEIGSTGTYTMGAKEKHAAEYNIYHTAPLVNEGSLYATTFSISGGTYVAKTGSLNAGWQNFAVAGALDGSNYICIVMHSPDEVDEVGPQLIGAKARPAIYEAGRLLGWGFNEFSLRAALDTTQAITEIRVLYSTDDDAVKLLPLDDVSTVLPVDNDDSVIIKEFDLPDSIPAPVRQGDIVGTVTLSLGGQVIGTSTLVAAKDVDRNNVKYAMEKFKEFFSTWYFKLLIILVVVIVIAYVILAVWFNNRKKQKARNPYLDNGKKRR